MAVVLLCLAVSGQAETRLAAAALKGARAPAANSTPPPAPTDPGKLYVLHCAGCHRMSGEGVPSAGVPGFRERIGHFLRLPQARAFLVQVPGVNNSGLDDAQIAAVTNWTLEHFGGRSLPAAGFEPLTAQEVARHRARRPVDVPAYRRRLAASLRAVGYGIDYP